MPSIDIVEQINVVLAAITMINTILPILPAMKFRLHESIDGGPGVGVSSRDVQFRAAEITQLLDLDYYLRY